MPNKQYDGPSMDYSKGMPMEHGDGPGMHHESAKQEKKDLMKDNPVVRDMDSSRPWMSKHASQSRMGGSPLKVGPDMGNNKKKTIKDKLKAGVKKVKGAAEGAAEFVTTLAKDIQKRGT
tara:strand:+ start:2635 stop:2991 length:357 start_codon:yes stop_codon:yes gene_type:complete